MNDENQLPVYTIDGKECRLRKYDTLTLEEEDRLIKPNGDLLEMKSDIEEFLKTVLVPEKADEVINYKSASMELITEIFVDFTVERNRFLASMGERIQFLVKQKQMQLKGS